MEMYFAVYCLACWDGDSAADSLFVYLHNQVLWPLKLYNSRAQGQLLSLSIILNNNFPCRAFSDLSDLIFHDFMYNK